MAEQTTASKMVASIELALSTGAGVVSVTVGDQKVDYDRKQALDELSYWRRLVAQENGTKARISSIRLDRTW